MTQLAQKAKKGNISAVHQKAAIVLRNHRGVIQLIKDEGGFVCLSTSIREAVNPLLFCTKKHLNIISVM